MRSMLIADNSEDVRVALRDAMQDRYQITLCGDGEAALAYLDSLRPDILILNLSLPLLDGLAVLRMAKHIPSVILATGDFISGYAAQCLKDFGVGHFLLNSAPVHIIDRHIQDLIRWRESPNPDAGDPQYETAKHLRRLGLPVKRDGYQQLKVCIPLFAQNPALDMSKELYSETAYLCGFDNYKQVERSIRSVIQTAWAVRDEQVWAKYFPPDANGCTSCPENKTFIARLAEILIETLVYGRDDF